MFSFIAYANVDGMGRTSYIKSKMKVWQVGMSIVPISRTGFDDYWTWSLPYRLKQRFSLGEVNTRARYFKSVREVLCFDVHNSYRNVPIVLREPFILKDIPMYLRKHFKDKHYCNVP